jgi:drug/metabolite transporter (DMT)-like permease
MTQAPIAAVATLRKTLVVFATLIGVTLLGEPHRAQRALALLVILARVVAVRLG